MISLLAWFLTFHYLDIWYVGFCLHSSFGPANIRGQPPYKNKHISNPEEESKKCHDSALKNLGSSASWSVYFILHIELD